MLLLSRASGAATTSSAPSISQDNGPGAMQRVPTSGSVAGMDSAPRRSSDDRAPAAKRASSTVRTRHPETSELHRSGSPPPVGESPSCGQAAAAHTRPPQPISPPLLSLRKGRNCFGYGTNKQDRTEQTTGLTLLNGNAKERLVRHHPFKAGNPVGPPLNPVAVSRIRRSFAVSS